MLGSGPMLLAFSNNAVTNCEAGAGRIGEVFTNIHRELATAMMHRSPL